MNYWMISPFEKTSGASFYTDQFFGNDDPAKTNDHTNYGLDIEKAEKR